MPFFLCFFCELVVLFDFSGYEAFFLSNGEIYLQFYVFPRFFSFDLMKNWPFSLSLSDCLHVACIG